MFAVLFLPLGICGFQNAVSQNYYGVSAEQNAVSAEQNGVLQSCDNQIVCGAERMTEYLPEIKGKKVGNSWFITRQAIEEFLQLN